MPKGDVALLSASDSDQALITQKSSVSTNELGPSKRSGSMANDQDSSTGSFSPSTSDEGSLTGSNDRDPDNLNPSNQLGVIQTATQSSMKHDHFGQGNTDKKLTSISNIEELGDKSTNNMQGTISNEEGNALVENGMLNMFKNNLLVNDQNVIKDRQKDTLKMDGKTAKMISGDIAGNIHDLFHAELPNPIHGTAFVLIDRLQPPTMPKTRAQPSPLRPQLVGNRGPVEVFSGLHTSSISKSLAANYLEKSREKAVGRQHVVPQPLKVEGSLNYDNFYRPRNVARTTAPPFQLDSLDDYYYYDYDYYDYPNSPDNSSDAISNITSSNVTETSSVAVINMTQIQNNITESPPLHLELLSSTEPQIPLPTESPVTKNIVTDKTAVDLLLLSTTLKPPPLESTLPSQIARSHLLQQGPRLFKGGRPLPNLTKGQQSSESVEHRSNEEDNTEEGGEDSCDDSLESASERDK